MRITFLCRGFESISLEYLSAALKKAGHSVTLAYDATPSGSVESKINRNLLSRFLFDSRENAIRQVVDSKPDLVGFSVVSDSYPWACHMAQRIKEEIGVPIIFGGIHPSSLPERVLKKAFVDYVCIGEGEEAIVELSEALSKKEEVTGILNIWKKKDGQIVKTGVRSLVRDLDSLPFPDKDLFYKLYPGFVNNIYWIICSRGCLYQCTFCYNSALKYLYGEEPHFLRRRSVGNIIKELKEAKEKYGIKKVFFLDDIFGSDLAWLREFSKKYPQEIGLPYYCAIFPHILEKKEEVISLLEKSGCTAVGMGVQSVDERIRKNILKRPGSNSEIREIIELFQKTKMFLYPDIILGLPLQNEEELIKTASFFNQHSVDVISTLWLRYYPKTEICAIAQENGFLTAEELRENEEGKDIFSPTDKGSTYNKNLAQLANLIDISAWLPQGIMNFLVKKRIYRFFPTINFYLLYHLGVFLLKRVRGKKKGPLYFNIFQRVYYYFYFVPLNIRYRWRINDR